MASGFAPSPQKQSSGPAKMGADPIAVTKRLQTELMSLMMSPVAGVSAFPEDDNMFSWIGTLEGPTGTPYESKSYKLKIKFPTTYPMTAPTIKFDTPMFHPNVDTAGNICLDILKDKWSAIYNVQTILLSLQSLLGEPNNDSPLNTTAANLWDNQPEYRKHVDAIYQN